MKKREIKSTKNRKQDAAIIAAEAEKKRLVALLRCIGNWFAEHPLAESDCREFVMQAGIVDDEFLDLVFDPDLY